MRSLTGLMLLFLMLAPGCEGKSDDDEDDDELYCGEGTHEEDGACVPDGTGGPDADADADADSDSDSDSDTDADADGSVEGLSDWVGSGSPAEFVRASDGELAWRIEFGACEDDDDDAICNYTVVLTGTVGRRCHSCDDQSVDLALRYTSTGQIQLDSVTLTEGSGMPLDITFGNLDIPLTPVPPYEVSKPYPLEAYFLGPEGYTFVFAGWVLTQQDESFTDFSGRDYTGCNTFLIGGGFDFDESIIDDEAANVTVCDGTGIVQVEIVERHEGGADTAEAEEPDADADADADMDVDAFTPLNPSEGENIYIRR